MHARELVEVASILCIDAEQLLHPAPAAAASPRLCQQALAEYWAASRCRLDEWGRRLSRLAHPPHSSTGQAGSELAELAEEIVLSQVLSRTMAAITLVHDRLHDHSEAGPIGRNTLAGHDEAVSRLRALAGAWWRPASAPASRLRRLTNRTQRWTDLLLGYVLPLCPWPAKAADRTQPLPQHAAAGHAVQFAFDPARAQEFAFDAQMQTGLEATGQMLQLAIREAFATTTLAPPQSGSPGAPFNRRIAGAAIGLFGPEAFDSHGLLRSTWLNRMQRTADDTFGLVEDLFSDPTPSAFEPPARWRM